ncbi:apolipoprotein(a)-like isoform X2 [Branchiostoma floridae x Branchiostoma japonicum]
MSWRCDGDQDCPDGSDELNCDDEGTVSPSPKTDREYMGCYKDTKKRRLPKGPKISQEMTPDFCIEHCIDEGYAYAGTQYYEECWCGNERHFSRIGRQRNDEQCNTPCQGNEEENCGGPWRLSVYKVGKKIKTNEESSNEALNVALNKKASQSSLLRSEYPAERAVDGNTGTILYPRQECTHTDLEYEPWWKVDLGDTYVISHVRVINRGDCCGERLRNFMVRVGPFEDFRENTPCGDIHSETPSDGETITVRCAEPISGRWVSVQLIGREDYLSLCEVQVYTATDGDPFECLSTSDGTTYRGKVRTTKSGHTCQRWDSSSPHRHQHLQKYPYHGLDENFCRNPTGRPLAEGPWCYTTDPDVEWEYCDIPECDISSRECLDGSTYDGKIQVTISGRTCQRWDSETPHVRDIRSPFPGLDENYCRNLPELGERNWPWCYTIDPDITWEYCRIETCVTDVLAVVDGYSPRRGDCPGNDIWTLYKDYVTLEECAQKCTDNPDCVSFLFYDNHRCYPKTKSCAETIKTNPMNVFYDRIIEEVASRKWREDYHCGYGYPAEGSDRAECDPYSCFPCCSTAGWCGNTPDHCDCPGCVNFQNVYGVAPIASIHSVPEEKRRWRDDYRCGPDFPAAGADPGECDPHSCFPCCSAAGHCGNIGVEHCDCPGCVDYRFHKQNGSRWRDDLRCGPDFPAPGAASGECDPVSFTPCCSISGFCGSTEEHCKCEGCVDFRTGSGITEESSTTTVEPIECLTDYEGTSYRGTRQFTQSGLTCQHWDSTFPHNNTYLEKFPNSGLDKNFCRNPDGRPDAERPWCYTTNPDVRWEYCDIPACGQNDKPKWRDDWRCGPGFSAEGADTAECDPTSCFPCCSAGGWCGITEDHCECPGCTNYQEIYGIPAIVKEETVAAPEMRWRDDFRCGPNFPAPGADPGECDPHSCFPCCSASGYCGHILSEHCDCPGCVDYRFHNQNGSRWRDDLRCGPDFPAPGAASGECDPVSFTPCCSISGFCGSTEEHCKCEGCVDFRTGSRESQITGNTATVEGYTSRHGDCPGNDIWAIYRDQTSLDDCARLCTSHPECVSFMFYNNHRCYPKTKSCADTTMTNPRNVFYDKILDGDPFECLSTSDGTTYRGRVRTTKSGHTCQRWDSTYPHEHKYLQKYPYHGLDENFCRNPEGRPDADVPWCYTTDPAIRWEYCDIPECDVSSRECLDGSTYDGKIQVTISGRTCQRWDSETPHVRDIRSPFPGLDENYCRNLPELGERNWPWCYTIDPNIPWEYCRIETCVTDVLAVVGGYSPRRGDCPGNDIWPLYEDYVTLEECAQKCTDNPDCVSFLFYDNHRCYPKTKSCAETIKTNPRNVFYDRIIEVVTSRKWREDYHCGSGYSAWGAEQAECDPHSCFPCCSAAGWCGNTPDHCDCPGCTNFQKEYGVAPITSIHSVPEEKRRWRDDYRCGPDFPAAGADPGECDPHSCFPCCSAAGHCGNIGVEHCDCPGCVDYRFHKQNGSRWRDDLRCGPDFPAPGAASGECDPVSFTPCCSISGFCGRTEEHCKCEGCVDFRTGSGVTEESSTTSVEPLECLTDYEGTSYRGTRQFTESGLTCQHWDSTFPHNNTYLEKFPNSGLDENFCRNPDGLPDARKPWCYTTNPDVRWEYCDIPACEDADDTTTTCDLNLQEQAERCKATEDAPICSGHGVCDCGQCRCHHSLPILPFQRFTGQFCECDSLSCDRYKGQICGGHGVCQCGDCVCEEGWAGAACECTTSVDNCISSNGLICNNGGDCQCGVCRCDPFSYYFGPQCEDCATCVGKCGDLRECGECLTGGMEDCTEVCSGLKVVQVEDINTDSSKTCSYRSATDREFEFAYEYAAEGGVVVRYHVVPSIVHPPVETTGVDEGVLSLFCEANVKLPIVWTKGGRAITSTQRRYDVVEYNDGRASQLRIDPLRRHDDDTFTCRLENPEDGSAVEASAPVNVIAEDNLPDGFPTITQHPQLKVVEKGRPSVLVCSARGDPDPDITWLKDMVPVDMADSRIKLLGSGSLQIDSVTEEDEGRYECVAKNGLGTRYSYPANLYIRVRRVPPRFSVIPEDIEVNRGDNINLTCVAVGSPMPSVQWVKGLHDLSDKPFQSGRSDLRLENVFESANYTCVASSELGVVEHTVQVTVKDPLAVVEGYTARRGDCPGNDIWGIYARSTTLEDCARRCTRHTSCAAFMFFDNQECYPKSQSCEETAQTNPKSVFYDSIVEDDVDGSIDGEPAAALYSEPPRWRSFYRSGGVSARLRSQETGGSKEAEAAPEGSGLVRRVFGLPIYRKRRHVPQDESSSDSFLAIGGKTYRFPSQSPNQYAVAELAKLPHRINRFMEVLVHLKKCALAEGQEQQDLASSTNEK